MNDTFIYLLLTLPFVAFSIVVYMLRKDLRHLIIKAGIAGGIVGLILEYWYFQDYWHPPTLFGSAIPSIEDFLFGSSATIVAFVFYVFVTKQKLPVRRRSTKTLIIPAAIGFIALILLTNVLGVNSIISTSLIAATVGTYILIRQPKLIKKSLISAAGLVGIATATYAVLFLILSPEYLDTYFLLSGHPANPTLFGFMPLAELMWYGAVGASMGLVYDHLLIQKSGSSKLAP